MRHEVLLTRQLLPITTGSNGYRASRVGLRVLGKIAGQVHSDKCTNGPGLIADTYVRTTINAARIQLPGKNEIAPILPSETVHKHPTGVFFCTVYQKRTSNRIST